MNIQLGLALLVLSAAPNLGFSQASGMDEYVVRHSGAVCYVVKRTATPIGTELVGPMNLEMACDHATRKHKPDKTGPCGAYSAGSIKLCKNTRNPLPES